MRIFADDAAVIDPHFPMQRMQGKAPIVLTSSYTPAQTCESNLVVRHRRNAR